MNRSVQISAALAWCYAAMLVVEAVGVGVLQGWSDTGHFIIHILGALIWSLLGVALLRGFRWAWYAVVTFGATIVLLCAGILVFAVLLDVPLLSLINDASKALKVASLGLPLFFVSLAALAGSLAMLLTREARRAFFPGSQPK